MVLKNSFIALMIACACVSTTAQSQSLGVESDKLESLQSTLEDLDADIERLENDLEYYDEALVEAVQELEAAKLEADTKQNRLSKQRILTKTDPSEANERELRLIEHSMSMAERGVESKERRLNRLNRKRSNIFEELKDNYQLKASTSSKTQQQLARVNSIKAKRAADLREKEIEKRAQELAEKKFKEQEAKRVAAARAKAAAEKAKQEAPVKKAELPQEAVTLAASGEAGNALLDAPAKKTSAADKEAVEDLDLQRRMDQLDRAMKRGGKPILKSLTVSGDEIKTTDFEFVGGEQYIAFVVLPAGRLSLIINGKRHTEVVEEQNAGVEHVLVYNHKNSRRPRLFSFKSALLELVDAPIKADTRKSASAGN